MSEQSDISRLEAELAEARRWIDLAQNKSWAINWAKQLERSIANTKAGHIQKVNR